MLKFSLATHYVWKISAFVKPKYPAATRCPRLHGGEAAVADSRLKPFGGTALAALSCCLRDRQTANVGTHQNGPPMGTIISPVLPFFDVCIIKNVRHIFV